MGSSLRLCSRMPKSGVFVTHTAKLITNHEINWRQLLTEYDLWGVWVRGENLNQQTTRIILILSWWNNLKSFRITSQLFHSIWNNILSNLTQWDIPFSCKNERKNGGRIQKLASLNKIAQLVNTILTHVTTWSQVTQSDDANLTSWSISSECDFIPKSEISLHMHELAGLIIVS